MERYVVFLVLFVSVVALQHPRISKEYRDYEYHEDTKAFYKLHIDEALYSEAAAICKMEGAALLVPTSIQDIAVIHAMFKLYPDIGEYVWIGDDGEVHEDATEDAVLDYSSREENLPMMAPVHHNFCPVLTREGQIEDHDCIRLLPYYTAAKLPFACKVDLTSAPYDPQCDVYATGYVYKEDLGSCYKISEVAITWNQAFSECRLEGAHLVVLNSQAESQAMKRLMSSKPLINNSYGPYYYIAGIRAFNIDGNPRVFRTVFNDTLEEAGFAEWADTEPNNLSGNENCGSLYETDGKYNDQDCNKPYGFICEKEKHT